MRCKASKFAFSLLLLVGSTAAPADHNLTVVTPLKVAEKCSDLITPAAPRPKTERSWFELLKSDLNLMYQNISPDNFKGAVAAATSRYAPNYWFNWVRDGGLTMEEVAKSFRESTNEFEVVRARHALVDFLKLSIVHQRSRLGLGEPKFKMDGSDDPIEWGRPQNDGPAFRALALIEFTNTLLDRKEQSDLIPLLYDGRHPMETNGVIKKDLEYIAANWVNPSYDVWEEVAGRHFFTLMIQRRALVEGAKLARRLNDPGAADHYEFNLNRINKLLARHWDAKKHYIVSTLEYAYGVDNKTSNLDSAVILGVLYGGVEGFSFSVADDRVMATALRLEETFKELYPLNRNANSADLGVAIGRYPEDAYDGVNRHGGNPWYLTTYAMGEYYYRLAGAFEKAGNITVTPRSLDVLKNAVSEELGRQLWTGRKINKGSALFESVISELISHGDGFVDRANFHRRRDGVLDEQFDSRSGDSRGATSLTWSYVAFSRAYQAREELNLNP